jgi:hypothetical protein
MKFTSLDQVVKGYLLQRRYPFHFYIDFLIYAQRCFEEISFDSIGNVRTKKLTINSYNAVTLPDDYMDWIKVGVENGQFVKPLINRPGINRLNNFSSGNVVEFGQITAGADYPNGTYTNVPLTGGTGTGATADITISLGTVPIVTLVSQGQGYTDGDILSASNTDLGGTGTGFSVVASLKVPFPAVGNEFTSSWPWYGFTVQWNDRLEYTGKNYGARVDRTDTFSIIPERNEIQLHNDIDATSIILEYISDGSEIDNATQITPYAKSTLEAYMNWKHKENGRSYGEGERLRAQREFDHQHRILRARINPLTIQDFKAAIYRNTSGAPK